MVADIEELEQMDASEIHARRLNAKEVLTPMKGDNFIFPLADGTVKISDGDHLRGESEGSSSTSRQDSSWYAGEAKNWFLVYYRRFHLSPSRGTKSRTLLADRRIIPYSTEIHWRYQTYGHYVICDVGEKYWRLLERWWRSWIVRYVDRIHKIHYHE